MEKYDAHDLVSDTYIGQYYQPSCKVYKDTDVDALLTDVRRLVEVAKHYLDTPTADEITKRLALHDLRQAISAVERHYQK